MNEKLDKQMVEALKHFERLQKMKTKVEHNKLSSRADVQHLRKEIATLNQEMIFSKRDMEQAKEVYDKSCQLYNSQKNQLKLFTEHLTVIIQNHEKEQAKHISKLLTAMKVPLTTVKPPVQHKTKE